MQADMVDLNIASECMVKEQRSRGRGIGMQMGWSEVKFIVK